MATRTAAISNTASMSQSLRIHPCRVELLPAQRQVVQRLAAGALAFEDHGRPVADPGQLLLVEVARADGDLVDVRLVVAEHVDKSAGASLPRLSGEVEDQARVMSHGPAAAARPA